jgi:uncharacterized membrane protein YbhN (UPF0104 family)
MSRNQIVFILGLLLVLVSFSGFPSRWRFYFTVAVGIILMLLAIRNYWLRREIIRMREGDSRPLGESTEDPMSHA